MLCDETMPGVIELHRAADRYETRQPGITTRHCFSSGGHYEPHNTAFGPLIAVDEHALAPGAGFARHAHRGVEILSWVLEGTLRHEDRSGHVEQIEPGTVLYQAAGSGIEHAERNGSDTEPLRFVQMWLLDDTGLPSRAATSPPVSAHGGTFAVLHPAAGSTIPAAPLVHAYLTRGTVLVAEMTLAVGDSLRVRDQALAVRGAGELLVWSMPTTTAGGITTS